jgi:uncharacterized membrane protein YraQ (UPF0718 family)
MISSFLILAAVTMAVAFYAWRRDPQHVVAAARFTRHDGVRLAIRLPFALVAASAIAELLPDRLIAAALGAQSGLSGILLASALGGLLPGGPMVSFPFAILVARDGAGGPQIIALITGWSVYAFHRIIAYEAPMMGWRFVGLRMIASACVPPATAIGAGVLAGLLGLSITLR